MSTRAKAVLGIDPGLSGALAVVSQKGEVLRIHDTPTIKLYRGTTKRKGKTVKREVKEVGEEALAALLEQLLDEFRILEAVVEKVGAMPKQGIASAFAFGQVYGQTRMALTSFEIPYSLVTPQKWKLAMGCGADKSSSVIACLDKFGDGNRHWWFGKNMGSLDGRCEAALLALYGVRYPQ